MNSRIEALLCFREACVPSYSFAVSDAPFLETSVNRLLWKDQENITVIHKVTNEDTCGSTCYANGCLEEAFASKIGLPP